MSQPVTALNRAQYSLTQYLRDPERCVAPEGVEPRRLAVYQELIFNNIEDFLSSGFPILRSLVQDHTWLALVRLFVTDYRAQSPYFLEIGQEFMHFVMASEAAQAMLPAFAAELMHYEWVELALDVAPETLPELVDKPAVTLATKIRLSALAWPLVYQYPVQTIGPTNQPSTIPAAPTFLLVHRDRQHRVKFMALNGLSYGLLDMVENNAEVDLQTLINRLSELVHGNQGTSVSPLFVDQGLALVQRFVDQDILHIC
ncbi:DUF2063 domain-containing protein [Simiduia litorea]|uniref:HvfC family RiPP maturation protein n=1 Tax=Simiduia litorea TaxID=1435348 RepID=UPI0036F3CEC2